MQEAWCSAVGRQSSCMPHMALPQILTLGSREVIILNTSPEQNQCHGSSAFAWYQILRMIGKHDRKVAKPLVSVTHGMKAPSLLKKNPPHRGEEEKEGKRKTRLKLGIYSKRSQQNVAYGQLHNREERRRSEGLLGTIKFLWWQPRMGRQGTEVAFRVLRTKRWCL